MNQNEPLKIVALDLSLARTGWAADTGAGVESGTQSFPIQKGKDPAFRYVLFAKWVAKFLDLQKPDVVIYERQIHRGAAATASQIGITAILQGACAARDIRYFSLQINQLKASATGHGHADKETMKQYAANKFPHYDPTQDLGGDEADALHILSYCQEHNGEAPEKKSKKRKAKQRELSPRDSQLLLDSLANPPEPNGELVDLYIKHKDVV